MTDEIEARKAKAREAQKRYRATPEGKRKHAAYMREYRARPNNAAWQRVLSQQRERRTGFTDETYARMFEEQGGVCAICGATGEKSRHGVLHGDHNHATGAPRGLLCSNCNTALGLFGEDPERINAALEYLARHASKTNGTE